MANQVLIRRSVLVLFALASTASAQDADLPEGIRLHQVISAPKPILDRQIRFARQGTELIAISDAGVHAFDVKTGRLLHTWEGDFLATAVSSDGNTLAAIDRSTEVFLHDLASRKRIGKFR